MKIGIIGGGSLGTALAHLAAAAGHDVKIGVRRDTTGDDAAPAYGPASRRSTRQVRIGKVAVGGAAPVVVQSMTNTDTADVDATTRQVIELARAGVGVHWRDNQSGCKGVCEGLPQEDCYVNIYRSALAVDTLNPCGLYFGTTGGQVYASADSGDHWMPIVRDLPAVLSVEVQSLS